MFDTIKVVRVIYSHADAAPLLAEAYEKYQAADSCVAVVDAVTPVEYKVARIADDLIALKAQTHAHDDLDTELDRVVAQVNSLAAKDGATAQKLFTRENLLAAVNLVQLLLPLLVKK